MSLPAFTASIFGETAIKTQPEINGNIIHNSVLLLPTKSSKYPATGHASTPPNYKSKTESKSGSDLENTEATLCFIKCNHREREYGYFFKLSLFSIFQVIPKGEKLFLSHHHLISRSISQLKVWNTKKDFTKAKDPIQVSWVGVISPKDFRCRISGRAVAV